MSNQAKTPLRRPVSYRVSSRPFLRPTLALLALALFLAAPPAAQAGKAAIGAIETLPGRPGSSTSAPKGVAVNFAGTGGAGAGEVYVVNSPNSRVEVFSATGTLRRAFGFDVAAAGPGNTGVNEQQAVTVDATGGSFTLTTGTLTTGFGDITKSSNVITNVSTATGAFHVGDGIEGCGIFPNTTITAIGAESLTLSAAATNLFFCPPHRNLTAFETTATIPFNTTAPALEAVLTALPGIDAGDVAVSGGPGATAPFTVQFTGVLAHNDVPQMTADSAALTGTTHTATVATSVPGGGFELCSPVSNPADVCKAGSESAVAGGLSKPSGIAIDQANGNVYVVDANGGGGLPNNRVNVYSATGAFEGAFGWSVNASAPAPALQFCTTATGCESGTPGTGTGQLGSLSTALPAVDPGNGHLYLPDPGNARVQEFVPTLNPAKEVIGISFVKAFGWDVVESGPDHQSNEIQQITVTASAGAYKLSFGAGGPGISETAPLPFDATHEEVQDALNALTNVSGAGLTVTVTGGPGDAVGKAPYTVTFESSPRGADVAQLKTTKAGLSGTATVETYNNGGKGLEVCAIAAGDTCKAGVPGRHLSQFAAGTPASVAVDSTGAVYAVRQSSSFVDEVGGPCLLYKTTFTGPEGIEVEEFASAQLTFTSGTGKALCVTDVTVDPANDHVLVAKKEGVAAFKFVEFDSAGTLLDESPSGVLEATANFVDTHGLAIGTGGRIYFSNPLGRVDILGPPPPPTVSIAPVGGVGSTTASFHGTVNPPTGSEHFQTGYHFEYSSDDFAHFSRFPAEDVLVGDGSGSGPPDSCPVNDPPSCEVQQSVTNLQPGAHYKVRLVATTGSSATSGTEEFTTDAVAPTISGTLAEEVGKTSADLTGFVNPNGLATSYHFEWGTDTTYGTRIPADSESAAGAGAAPMKVSTGLTGLKEGVTYHFRIVAENTLGEVKGPDQAFTALSPFGLPDGRAPEQVSPIDKRPVGQVAAFTFTSQIVFRAARDGDRVIYPLLNGLPDATAGGNLEYLGQRNESPQWHSRQLTPPSLIPPPFSDLFSDATGIEKYASEDLACQVVESFEPLTEDTPAEDLAHGARNLYRRSLDGTYTLLTSLVPLNVEVKQGAHEVNWASEDCGHVLFESGARFLPGAPASGSGLYEWAEGTLRLVGVRPDGSVASNAVGGGGAPRPAGTALNSVSADGSRVFFSATSNEGANSGMQAVFVRSGGSETVDASQSQTGTANDGHSRYQMASADGSHLFFTARYGLAANGTSSGASSCANIIAFSDGTGCDLYDFDTETEELTDLSVDANLADTKGAGVAGVLDASADGSRVYFAARGQLLAGEGRTEAQNLFAETYSVYLRDAGALSYVGPISEREATTSDMPGGGDLAAANHAIWAADATPDGSHLLFVSRANVTGYESNGSTQAYLYAAQTGKTVCVSCPAEGEPSVAGAAAQPIATTVKASSAGSSKIQVRPRSLSDDGRRVFFRSPDVLASGAREGRGNIYEWEEGQVYLLVAGEGGAVDLTEYADASASGDDVFVATKAPLSPHDFDTTRDLYDLRAPHTPGEAIGPPEAEPAQEPCDPLADRCQEAAKPQPGAGIGAASEGAGPGNPPAAKPCKKGQVRKHGRCVRKPARHKKKHKSRHKRTAHANERTPR